MRIGCHGENGVDQFSDPIGAVAVSPPKRGGSTTARYLQTGGLIQVMLKSRPENYYKQQPKLLLITASPASHL
jgi:hypothetical protein